MQLEITNLPIQQFSGNKVAFLSSYSCYMCIYFTGLFFFFHSSVYCEDQRGPAQLHYPLKKGEFKSELCNAIIQVYFYYVFAVVGSTVVTVLFSVFGFRIIVIVQWISHSYVVITSILLTVFQAQWQVRDHSSSISLSQRCICSLISLCSIPCVVISSFASVLRKLWIMCSGFRCGREWKPQFC